MTKQELANKMRDFWVNGDERKDIFETCASYILDNFVAKEDVKDEQETIRDLLCELEKWKALKTNVFSQDSKPRECKQPKPTLPDVPEKFFSGLVNTISITEKIDDLITCYSALKKVVEEKL